MPYYNKENLDLWYLKAWNHKVYFLMCLNKSWPQYTSYSPLVLHTMWMKLGVIIFRSAALALVFTAVSLENELSWSKGNAQYAVCAEVELMEHYRRKEGEKNEKHQQNLTVSSLLFCSRENPKHATRITSSKSHVCLDTRPDSITPASVIYIIES